ncbi:DUF7093 family protein [Halorussus marinus]|uniref:DUF7093 family protein n=1 Tax=Halorussus marinus TaxID=2505976 RepID=UPI001091E276|nr:oxidoreductase [Halorussus marinus]
MSLRCSLLGHAYGDTEIEREREEQGSEVVVTVREFEECQRCGERSVVTENKEVTAIDPAARDRERAESESEEPSASAPTGTAGSDDAGAEGVSESVGASAAVENEFEAPQSAEDDDAVILDDEADEESGDADRESGEWPDADSTHPAEAGENRGRGEWPEVGQEDEGYDARPDDEDAEVEFGGGLAPESAPEVDESEAEEVEFVNAEGDTLETAETERRGRSELSAGFTAGSEAPSVSGPADDPDVDAEFVCPECGYRAGVAGSSLRAGDICPECRKGYIARE